MHLWEVQTRHAVAGRKSRRVKIVCRMNVFLSHARWRRRGIPVQDGGSYRSWSGKSRDAPVGRSPGDVFSGA